MSLSRNWWVVFAAFLCLVFMFGVPTFMMPVLYSPIIDEFGWSRTQVTLIATMKFGAGAVIGLLFGVLLDRMSIRKIVLFSGTLSGLAMIAFLAIHSLTMFYIIGLFLGLGAVGVMISMKVLVSRRFREQQGFAVGAALLGTSVGGTVTPTLARYLIETFGWREAAALMSAGIWLVALPVFLWIVKDEDFEEAEDLSGESRDFSTVLRQRSFWMLAAAVLLIGFVDQAMSQHFVLYLDKDVGLGLAVAAGAASAAALISIFGKVGFGWVYDKLSTKGVMICYVLMALAVLIAIPVQGSFLLGALVLTRGLAHGGAIVDIPVLSKHCFGPNMLGRTIGVLTACVTVGFAAGPPVVGYIYDTQGTYRYAFMLLAVMSLAAGAAVLGARPVYWEENIRKPAGGRSAGASEPAPAP
ncbi:MAG: MFS transporter [Acidobacteria bacterium]|nr:MAG: MFS transporter [Acidobacteriota bacterium]